MISIEKAPWTSLAVLLYKLCHEDIEVRELDVIDSQATSICSVVRDELGVFRYNSTLSRSCILEVIIWHTA